jgi:acetolactate synthase regulatory subunit
MSFPASRDSVAPTPSVACFAVTADAEPSAFPRVLGLFAARGLVPIRMHAAHDGDDLSFDLQIGGLESDDAEILSWRLRALVCVRSVLCVTKQDSVPATTAR